MSKKIYTIAIEVLLAVMLTTIPVGASDETDGISFTLNGMPIDPVCRTLGSLGIDGDGVLVSLGDVTLMMDRAESYSLEGNLEKDGKLHLVLDGRRQLIGIKTGRTYVDDKRASVDPFAGMKPSDMEHVRGILLDDVLSEYAVKMLALVNCSRVFITVTGETASADNREFPPVPEKTRFLAVHQRSSDGIEDYSYLSTLMSLVHLELSASRGSAFDAALIKGAAHLVYLDLSMLTVKNLSIVANLYELRQLDLSYNDELRDIAFVRELARLERLKIGRTKVLDLSPVEDLKHIAFVDANGALVSRLPRKKTPSLKKLKIVGTPLTMNAVTAFKDTNPQCRVSYDWNETLQDALAGADGIRVRPGGTCHIRPGDDKTLFEIKEAKEVENVISRIRLNPAKSDFHCMCCGDPSFEFYKGGNLVVTLGFHHGRSLRWMAGEWPGDGLLTSDSGDFLCTLLDKYGIKGPLAERLEEREREKATARRWGLYDRVLPDDVKSLLSEAKNARDAHNAFILGEKDKLNRVALGLRIIGCDRGSWNQSNLLDPIILALLDNKLPSERPGGTAVLNLDQENAISASDIVEAIEKNKDDAMLLQGAARWFFGEKNYGYIPEEKMGAILPLIARHGLIHPRQINRRKTLFSLKRLNNAIAEELLLSVLAGEFEALQMNPEEAVEPGGMIQFRPEDSDVPDECSDQAYAALILAESGIKEILPEVRALLKAEENPGSKEVLQRAFVLLEKKQ